MWNTNHYLTIYVISAIFWFKVFLIPWYSNGKICFTKCLLWLGSWSNIFMFGNIIYVLELRWERSCPMSLLKIAWIFIKDVLWDSCTQRKAESLRMDPHWLGIVSWMWKILPCHLPQLLQKGELENNDEIKVASKKTVHAYHWLSKIVSKERGMNKRVILNLIIIFEVFFPVHTCKS